MATDISRLLSQDTDVQRRILLEMNKIASLLQDSRLFGGFPRNLHEHLEQLKIANSYQEEAIKRVEQIFCYLSMLAGNAHGVQQHADAYILYLGRDMMEDTQNRRLMMTYPDGIDYKYQAYEYEEAFERICTKLKVKRMPAPQRMQATVYATILLTNKLNYLSSSLNMQKKHATDYDQLAEAYTAAIAELKTRCRVLADSNYYSERQIGQLRDYLQVYQAHDGSLANDVAHLRDALAAKQCDNYRLENELQANYQANARLCEESNALRFRIYYLTDAESAYSNETYKLQYQISAFSLRDVNYQRLNAECKELRQKIREQQYEAVQRGIAEESLRSQLLSDQYYLNDIVKRAAALKTSLMQQEKVYQELNAKISLLWQNYAQKTTYINEERSYNLVQLQSLREELHSCFSAARAMQYYERTVKESGYQLAYQRETISELRQALAQSRAQITELEQENKQLTCSRVFMPYAQQALQIAQTVSAEVQTTAVDAEPSPVRAFEVYTFQTSAYPQIYRRNASTSTIVHSETVQLAESTLDGFLTGVKRDLGLSVSRIAEERGVQTVLEPYEDHPDYEALLEVAKDLRTENDGLRYYLKAKLTNSSQCQQASQNASTYDHATQSDVEKNLRAYLFVYQKQILYLKKQVARYETYIQSLHLDDDEIVKIVVGEDSLESRKISELESLVHVLQLYLCEI